MAKDEDTRDIRTEPIFSALPGDLQIELNRLIANGRKRTRGRSRLFKPSSVDPALVREMAKTMSMDKIRELLMFSGTTKELDQAFAAGRAEGVGRVADKLYRMALEGVPWAVKMYLMSRDPKTWRDTPAPVQQEQTQAATPDPYACLSSRTSEELLRIAGGH